MSSCSASLALDLLAAKIRRDFTVWFVGHPEVVQKRAWKKFGEDGRRLGIYLSP